MRTCTPVKNATGETGFVVSSAGTTAVWADENTRAGIFEAMERKETYGTTGTLIRLRFFGGWDYPKDLTTQDDWVKKAYTDGVPMGRDLPTMPTAVKAPTFAVWAQKDPARGNLDLRQTARRGQHGRCQDRDLLERFDWRQPVARRVDGPGFRSYPQSRLLRASPRDTYPALVDL